MSRLNLDPVRFQVLGIAKGRAHTRPAVVKREGVYTGRTISIPEQTRAQGDWFHSLQQAALHLVQSGQWVRVDEGAVYLSILWLIQSRISDLKAEKKGQPASRVWKGIDCSNLVKAAEDRWNGILWRDDAQVEEGPMPRRYCRGGELPGAYCLLIELGTHYGETFPVGVQQTLAWWLTEDAGGRLTGPPRGRV